MDLTQLLSMVALETVKFLKRFQQKCKDPQWWKNYVISSLSPRDLRGISDFDSGDLEKLDIAALLKVLKKHWGTIEFNMNVDFEKKHLIDELKTIRNDLCHQGATEKTSMADQHRIIDTMYRFLVLLNADEKNLNLMREEMEKAVRNIANQYGIGKDDKLNHITGKEHVMKEGMALNIFKKGISANKELSELLRERTFVGIDFGTSTTVASYVKHDKEKDILVVNPIPIRQYDDLGREDKNHLLPSCIAWTGKKLLIGTGAVNLKTKYEYEKNIWFSFKMLLGTDLGPQYYRSELRDRSGDYYIETPCDAAAVFFRYLRTEVEAYVKSENLPSNIVYSVSAPAGFESNQRRDLCEALKKAGFAVDHYKIIDEPNAAFIDFIMTKLHEGDWLIDSLQNEGKKILVFDFGAGTCDISILEVKLNNGLWSSKNRGISQFFSLGGDNIDRQIATQVLLAQLIEESGISPDDISSAELDKVIIPKLMPCAEKLKVNCCKQLANSGAKSYEQFKKDESKISGVKISPINFRNKELVLNNPSITHKQFYEVMEPFITPNLNEHKAGWENTTSIFLPISNAMQKAAIDKNNLNIVLFIGGSSQNPYVQDAVKKYFGHGVEKECPTDMRTPVSHGVAMNSLMVNGLGLNLIHPISSEDVIIVAKEGNITLFPAGTEIPSVEVIIADFKPQRDGQKIIEIPICVSLEEKLLGVIKLESEKGFKKKDEIIVKGKFNENKFLEITAAVSGKDEIIQTAVLNPLSNKPLSKAEKMMEKARKKLYESMTNGIPDHNALSEYAEACSEAGRYQQAAEAFISLDRIDKSNDYSIDISYNYANAGKIDLAKAWEEKAYEKNPCSVSAFNLALSCSGNKARYVELMEESLEMDPEAFYTMEAYGSYLLNIDKSRAMKMIEKAFDIMSGYLEEGTLSKNDKKRLQRVSLILERNDMVERLENIDDDVAFSSAHLASNVNKVSKIKN